MGVPQQSVGLFDSQGVGVSEPSLDVGVKAGLLAGVVLLFRLVWEVRVGIVEEV